jgi:hypothetical protein
MCSTESLAVPTVMSWRMAGADFRRKCHELRQNSLLQSVAVVEVAMDLEFVLNISATGYTVLTVPLLGTRFCNRVPHSEMGHHSEMSHWQAVQHN